MKEPREDLIYLKVSDHTELSGNGSLKNLSLLMFSGAQFKCSKEPLFDGSLRHFWRFFTEPFAESLVVEVDLVLLWSRHLPVRRRNFVLLCKQT